MVGDAKIETELLNKMDNLLQEYSAKLSPAQLMGCFTFEQFKLFDLIKSMQAPKIEKVHGDLKNLILK